ncbi:MAG: DnaJ domain-containing protein [Planctomycetaceae bacterium]|nr:DnaJ domain-containing protein [Planctomycetaceae bacterium]
MPKRDYYDVMGVARDATKDQIKTAYRKLARKFHPDVNKSPDAPEKFREATEAYEVLSDDDKRRMYDRFGHAGPGMGGGGRTGQAPPRGAPGQGFGGGFDFEEIFGRPGGSTYAGMGLDEILDALRGGRAGGGAGRRGAAWQGADLQYDLTLEFLQAIRGVTTSIRLQRQDGGGKSHAETIEVKIPPGVRDGQQIRLRGQGQSGPGGSGDLYIVAHVGQHPYFHREGNDIYVEVPISITEAALGAAIDVPTIDGMTRVRVPAGSSSGRRLRLRGKGVPAPAGGEAGDEYVQLKTVAPTGLTDRQRELLEEFAKLDTQNPRKDVPWA